MKTNEDNTDTCTFRERLVRTTIASREKSSIREINDAVSTAYNRIYCQVEMAASNGKWCVDTEVRLPRASSHDADKEDFKCFLGKLLLPLNIGFQFFSSKEDGALIVYCCWEPASIGGEDGSSR